MYTDTFLIPTISIIHNNNTDGGQSHDHVKRVLDLNADAQGLVALPYNVTVHLEWNAVVYIHCRMIWDGKCLVDQWDVIILICMWKESKS